MRRTGGSSEENRETGSAPAEERDRAREIVASRGDDVVRARRRVLRRGSGEAIHDLRVATRRLQAALEVFGARLPERPRRRLDRRARKIRRQLGAARNARVLLGLLRRFRAHPGTAENRFVAGLVRRLDRSAGSSGRSKGRRTLPGVRKRIQALLRAMADRAGSAAAPAGAALQGRVEAVLRAGSVARQGDPESMHRLRIAVKRYRYVLEVLAEAGAPMPRPAIGEARALQRELGRLHDLDVLIEWVRGAAYVPVAGAFLRRILRQRSRQAERILRRLAVFRPARVGGTRRTAA
jgi:CHAD domain-containing protein